MQYLSRMSLNPRRRQARVFVNNPRAMHAAVMSCFSPESHAEMSDGRILWRLDEGRDQLNLWIVSAAQPSFEHLQEQAGWANQVSWDTREYDQLLNRLMKGQRYGFRLAANPVISRHKADGKVQRLAHVTASQQLDWFLQRQEQLGISAMFPLNEAGELTPMVQVTSRKVLRFPRNGKQVTLARAQFDGELEVTDAEKLRNALINGLGKSKGYGMGLLTLASAPSRRSD